MSTSLDAAAVIELLDMAAHPEGGWFRETWRDGAGTAIWFLLRTGERSHWHRVLGCAEIWHHYVGDALTLRVSTDGVTVDAETLGPDLAVGERPQLIVPPGTWQSAAPTDGPHGYALVGCTVSPPFRFEAFELAPPGWEPG